MDLKLDPDANKATVVSIFPFELKELKPGLHPGYFNIPKCESYDNPIIFHVGNSMYNIYLGDKRNFPVEVPAIKVARSIADDVNHSMLESDEDAHPGLMALEGIINELELKMKYKPKVESLKNTQTAWFRKLVVLADNDWQRYRVHSCISDIQRKAAQMLNLSREWLDVAKSDVPVVCPACKSLIPADALICKTCKVVLNPEAVKKFEFATSVK